MNTALFKPSNVIASVVEPTLLLFNLNASSKEFKTDESKSLAVIVPSKISSDVTEPVSKSSAVNELSITLSELTESVASFNTVT